MLYSIRYSIVHTWHVGGSLLHVIMSIIFWWANLIYIKKIMHKRNDKSFKIHIKWRDRSSNSGHDVRPSNIDISVSWISIYRQQKYVVILKQEYKRYNIFLLWIQKCWWYTVNHSWISTKEDIRTTWWLRWINVGVKY
jgi:hypothetical protein